VVEGTRVCARGGHLLPPDSRRNVKWCSPRCKEQARAEVRRSARLVALHGTIDRVCAHLPCEVGIPSEAGGHQRYCSSRCAQRAQADRVKAPAATVCLHCSEPIRAPKRGKLYCTNRCTQLAHYYAVRAPRQASERRVARSGRTCAFEPCSSPISDTREANAIYCQAACRHRAKYQRYRKQHKEYRDRVRRGAQWRAINRTYAYRRRARAVASTIVAFTPVQLAARLSMWPGCWMCGAPWTDVDHVKPLARGGAHALANLRPACRGCNLRKGSTWFGVAHVVRLRRSLPSDHGHPGPVARRRCA
jgi:5-methylcytosine-specific restriction endonuclease McrA